MDGNDFCCKLCNLKLKSVFISCMECAQDNETNSSGGVYICLECFSQGLENSHHKCNHSYKILNLNRIKTFSNWCLNEDLSLIEHQSDLNAQNWSKISTYLQESINSRKTPYECKVHFDEWLNVLNNERKLENFEINSNIELFVGDESFVMREHDINPPRPSLHTYQYRRMSGYRAARGDFEAEYNNGFEMKYISDIDYTDLSADGDDKVIVRINDDEEDVLSKQENEEFLESLKLIIVDSYRDLIKERYKIKKFIRDFGLLNDLTIVSMHNQVMPTASSSMQKTTNPHNFSQFQQKQHNILPIKFFRLFKSSESLTQYIELVKYQNELKKRVQELYEYRNNGLRRFKNVDLYKKMKSIRENRQKNSYLSSLLTTVIRHDVKDNKVNAYNCKEWIKKFINEEKEIENVLKPSTSINSNNNNIANSSSSSSTAIMSSTASLISQQKYKNNPLKIENYPEADKLNDEEKEFCRLSRIQPTVYLRVKQIIILECNKVGFVTYSRARKIASIDVNKTRKIHNFLLHLNLIKSNDSAS